MKTWRVLVTYKVPRRAGEWAVLSPCYQYFDQIEAQNFEEAWTAGVNLAKLIDPELLPWSIWASADETNKQCGVANALNGCVAKGWRHVTAP